MLLLDNTSPRAVIVDPAIPQSAAALHEALASAWPRLAGGVEFVPATLDSFPLRDDDVVVSSHACGALTDQIIEKATGARARLAVLPCCHDADTCDAGSLEGWMDLALAVDSMRVVRLEQRGYQVRTQKIPATITPKNRLLLGEPATDRQPG
jgi:hypothetical protein